LTRYLSNQEVIITSDVGLGNYHFFWVDKSLCQPYHKSLTIPTPNILKYLFRTK